MCFCQAADFADRVASGPLTADVAAEVERLRAQHADAVREKSAAESKNRRLAEKVAALEAEKTDLRCQLVEERREANQAIAEEQAAQAEAKVARAEGSLASQRAEEWEVRFNALCGHVDKAEASARSICSNSTFTQQKLHIPTRNKPQKNNNLHLLSRPVGSLPDSLPTMRPPTSYQKVPPLIASLQGLRP
jgi:chromosome segregation ATPase